MRFRIPAWQVASLVLGTLAAASAAEPVDVFFRGGSGLAVVRREVPPGMAAEEAAIAALAAGPTADEQAAGLYSAIAPGTRVQQVVLADDAVSVDFSAELLAGGVNDELIQAVFQQVNWTLRQFGRDRVITLTVDGAPLWSYLPPKPKPTRAPAPPAAPSGLLGSLSGRSITVSPGHGYMWNGSSWVTQRPVYCSPLNQEDFHNLEMCQYLEVYLLADGATVRMSRCTNKNQGTDPTSGKPWWQVAAYVWLKYLGYPCSVYASATGDCTLGSGSSESSDDIRSRPLASDYDNTDIYVSLHTNGYTGDCTGSCPTGTETYYDASTEHAAWGAVSQTLANHINSSIMNAITANVDSSWTCHGTCVKNSNGNYGEIRIPDRAATLTELAFHDTCDRDAIHLRDNFFRSAAMWGMYKGICTYFGTSPTWDFYSDEYVSNTVPSTMNPGQSYTVDVTFRNRGVLWNSARNFRLGAVGDSDPFTAFNRVSLPGEVGPGQTCTFTFTMTAPTTPGTYTTEWRMVRDGVTWFGATYSEQITVTGGDPLPPTVTDHPVSQTVAFGATASFTALASGSSPLSYRWQKDGADLTDGGKISGATSTTLQISSVDYADAASYRCVVTNAYGSATSNAATLAVTPNAFIVESRSGGQNFAKYSETGVWGNSGGKSTAAGTTAGIGSRYGSTYRSVAGEKHALFDADLPVTGPYEIFVTWSASSNRRTPILHRITHAGGTTDVNVDQTATANVWLSLGTFTCNAGTNSSRVDVSNLNIDASGSMYADAVKWEFRGGTQPPTITQHPSARSVCPGATTTFTVAASGSGPLAYQWQKGGANIADGGHYSGTATGTLTVSGADADDVANYRCVVTNPGGSVTSNQAALTLKAATVVTQHPAAQSACPGEAVQLSVAATGDGTLTYRWRKNGDDLNDGGHYAGATTAMLTITNADAGDAGDYACVVTGGCGSATSNAAAVTLRTATTVTQHPAAQDVCPGGSATFSVAGNGEGTVTYQWQKDGADIAGATAAVLQLDNVQSEDAGDYRCIVTAACGSVASDTAALTLKLFVADFNADCDVDMQDFAAFQTCFNGPNAPPAAGCAYPADFDGDADVDLSDFATFQACFNGPNQVAGDSCPRR